MIRFFEVILKEADVLVHASFLPSPDDCECILSDFPEAGELCGIKEISRSDAFFMYSNSTEEEWLMPGVSGWEGTFMDWELDGWENRNEEETKKNGKNMKIFGLINK